MARLNVEELVGGLLEAAMVSQGISERQHINALRNYFNEDGTPKTTSFNVGGKDLVVPLYILADHSSIGLENWILNSLVDLYLVMKKRKYLALKNLY